MILVAYKQRWLSLLLGLLFCGSTASLAGNRFSVAPAVTFTRFGQDLSFNQAFGYGLVLAYHPDSELCFGLSGFLTPTEEEFALVGGVGRLTATVGMIRLQAEYRIVRIGSSVSLLASAQIGALFISTDEYRVSLGALGQTTIAPRSETIPLYGGSLIFHQHIAGAVSFRLEPGASLYSHNGSSHSLISIAGGISVGIL